MRIGLVTETFPPEVNGVAMTNLRLVRGLMERGHELFLVKPNRGEWGRQMVPPGAGLREVVGCPVPRYPGLRVGFPAPGCLKRYFRRMQPDLVHLATEGPLGWSALRAARGMGVPVTSTFHTNFQDYCRDYGAGFLQRAMLGYLRYFHNRCALTTVPDPGLIGRLESEGLGRLQYLGRGADTALFAPARRCQALRDSWGAGVDDPVALYVGRVAAEKNIPMVLRAWQAAREVHRRLRMVVVGDGPCLRGLRRKWPEVHFAGMRYEEDLAAHYASADVFLFGSESETFGNVVLEAMASGLLVITYNYAAGAQLIRHRENGVLVPLGEAADFIRAVSFWMERREDWTALRLAARETARGIPWSGVIDAFAGMLEACTGGGGDAGINPVWRAVEVPESG